jgi:hypothetical protein
LLAALIFMASREMAILAAQALMSDILETVKYGVVLAVVLAATVVLAALAL